MSRLPHSSSPDDCRRPPRIGPHSRASGGHCLSAIAFRPTGTSKGGQALTALQATPKHTMRSPVAAGSRVPACPTCTPTLGLSQ